jgi:hypothetical protein
MFLQIYGINNLFRTSSLCTDLRACGGQATAPFITHSNLGPKDSNYGTIFNSTAENSTLFDNNNKNSNKNQQPFTVMGSNNTIDYHVHNYNINLNLNQATNTSGLQELLLLLLNGNQKFYLL